MKRATLTAIILWMAFTGWCQAGEWRMPNGMLLRTAGYSEGVKAPDNFVTVGLSQMVNPYGKRSYIRKCIRGKWSPWTVIDWGEPKKLGEGVYIAGQATKQDDVDLTPQEAFDLGLPVLNHPSIKGARNRVIAKGWPGEHVIRVEIPIPRRLD